MWLIVLCTNKSLTLLFYLGAKFCAWMQTSFQQFPILNFLGLALLSSRKAVRRHGLFVHVYLSKDIFYYLYFDRVCLTQP